MIVDPLALPKPKEPFRGILPFRLLDWRIFFEREAEIERLKNLVSLYRGVLLYGQSGTGKSSLLNAGLMSQALRKGRAPERIRVYPKKGKELFVEPIGLQEGDDELALEGRQRRFLPSRFIPSIDTPERVQISCREFLEALKAPSDDQEVPLLIFDQFEELVTLFEVNPKDPAEIEEAQYARDEIHRLICELLLSNTLRVKLVFAFRDDYLARLTPLFSKIPNLLDQTVQLPPPRIELLRQIVRGPFMPSPERGLTGNDFGNELSEEVATKIEEGIRKSQPAGVLNLSEVQTLCLALWRQPKRREELLRPAADTAAILRKIIESEAVARLHRLHLWDRIRAIGILSNLVTEDGTRDVVSEPILVSQTRRNLLLWFFFGNWRSFLGRLPKTGLVRRSLTSGKTYYYELTSEFLIPRIQRWQQKLRTSGQIAFIVLCGLLVAYMWRQAHRANRASRQAKWERQKTFAIKQDVDQLLSFMQYDVSDSFKKLGRPDMLKAINDRITKHFEEFPPAAGDLNAIEAKAIALMQRGDLLQAQPGKLLEAAEKHREALDLFLGLLAKKPGSTDYQRDISVSYERLADMQRAQGDLSGALQNYRKSLAIAETLARMDPANAEWQRDLSVSYERIGDVLNIQGLLSEALNNYRSCMTIRHTLSEHDPANATARRDLFVSYQRMGEVMSAQGDLKGALDYYRQCLDIAKTLVGQDPDSRDLQRDLSTSYESVGNVLQAQGNLTAALKNYRDGRTLREELVRQEPDNLDFRNILSVSYAEVGDVLRDQGDLDGALKEFRDGLALAEKLVQDDPENAHWQAGLVPGHIGLGNVLKDKEDFVTALKNYRDAQAVLDTLAKRDPTNATWSRTLSFTYERIGNVLREQGDLAGALQHFTEGLARTQKLLQKNQDSCDWQQDLADLHADIGTVHLNQGNLVEALKSFRDCLGIREKLASRDSTNAIVQGDLGWTYWQTGAVLEKVEPGSKEQAVALIKKGRDILRHLKEQTSLTAEQQEWLRQLEAESGK
jgi:tetratricopeptide (TPR) repeat protein